MKIKSVKFVTIMWVILVVLVGLLMLVGCKPDRIDHTDKDYIYVWQYHDEDSTLVKFHQPIYIERKVYGGHHHKSHHIKVDMNNNGRYECVHLPDRGIDRCATVDRAQHTRTPLTGVFKVSYYPHYNVVFVKYK